MVPKTEKGKLLKSGQTLSPLLLLIAGLFLSPSANQAAWFQWHQVREDPSPAYTSGWLTIPDEYATPGFHFYIIPPSDVSGSFESHHPGSVYTETPDPDHLFGVLIWGTLDHLLLSEVGAAYTTETQPDYSQLGNFWTNSERPDLDLHWAYGIDTTKVGFDGRGMWELAPDGGSTLISLLAGLSALGIAGRHARLRPI